MRGVGVRGSPQIAENLNLCNSQDHLLRFLRAAKSSQPFITPELSQYPLMILNVLCREFRKPWPTGEGKSLDLTLGAMLHFFNHPSKIYDITSAINFYSTN
jgi:hypothetical protein